MTRMTSEQFSRQWEIARRICNYKVSGVFKPTIAGGSAIDTYLKRVCKDFDTYFPESLLEHFDVQDFCNSVGLGTESEINDDFQILNTEKDYGECTLRYVIKGDLLGSPVHIEIITYKAEANREDYAYDYVKEFYDPNVTDQGFVRDVLSTFSVNTSMCAFYGTSCDNLVLTVPVGLVGHRFGISQVKVYDMTSQLMDKSLQKYDQYAAQPPFFFEPGSESKARSNKSSFLSNWLSFTNLNGGLIRISMFPYDYSDGALEYEVQTSNRRRDKAVSTDLTTWDVPSVRERNTTGTSVPRPRPFDWASAVRAPQELQPARVEAPQLAQEIWSTAIAPTTVTELRGRMDGFISPAAATSRPSDEF